MTGKWIDAACLALCLALLATACATELMVVSDIHYLAKPLYEGSDLFLRALRTGDGKITQYGDELMAALCAEAARRQPDALIVTGDLSFNGERASHVALADWFGSIEAQGVPVWVIPGNHDINSPTPRHFEGDSWTLVEGVTPEEFSAIYADFMQPAEGDANLSYAVPVDDRLWVAMTDVSFYQDVGQTFGLFTAGHADWLEDAARRAGEAELITATHHSLLAHTEFSRDSFLMFGSETMAGIARKYGVRLNLSGHMHAQHIVDQDGLTDAALGGFCIWPHRYALVTLDGDGSLTYEAKALDGDFLPEGFLDMSREWYLDIATEKTRASLEGVDDATAQAMASFAARFTQAYFSGTCRGDDPSWRDDPARELWREYGDGLMWQTMELLMNESGGDNLCRHWN